MAREALRRSAVEKPDVLDGFRLPLGFTERRLLAVLGDGVAAAVAGFVALEVWRLIARPSPREAWLADRGWWIPVLAAVWVAGLALCGGYRLMDLHTRVRSMETLGLTAAVVMIAYALAYFVSPPTSLPRIVAVVFVVAAAILGRFWRTAWSRLSAHWVIGRRVIIAGAGETGLELAGLLASRPSAGGLVVGFVDDDPAKQGRMLEVHSAEDRLSIPVLGPTGMLPELVRRLGAAEVALAVRGEVRPGLLDALLRCRELGVTAVSGLSLYESLTGRVPVDHVGDKWDVALPLGQFRNGLLLYPGLKRLVDITFAVVGLALFAPLLLPIAVAVRLDSAGPVFYRQTRVGRNGKHFVIWKLRTMRTDAEPDGRAVWAAPADHRATRVGRLLRKARLDEAPQLWNVLRGDMSIVGPRPERPELDRHLEQSVPFYRLRYTAKPGLTGWATLHNGYVDDPGLAKARLEYDLYYIKHQSLWLDAQIIVRTAQHVAALRGR